MYVSVAAASMGKLRCLVESPFRRDFAALGEDKSASREFCKASGVLQADLLARKSCEDKHNLEETGSSLGNREAGGNGEQRVGARLS